MADNNRKQSGIGIGSTMLVLIFGIVTLTTFSILAVASANADWKLAKKNRDMVSSYYQADARGEEILMETDRILAELGQAASDPDAYAVLAAEAFGEAYSAEGNTLTFREELNDQIRLCIVLEIDLSERQNKNYHILAWNTESYGDYQMDHSINVWKGENPE